MGSKDSGHVGDFVICQCASCFFSVHNLQSGKNIIYIKIRIITPSEWCQISFTASVKLTNLFYDMRGRPYEDKILPITSGELLLLHRFTTSLFLIDRLQYNAVSKNGLVEAISIRWHTYLLAIFFSLLHIEKNVKHRECKKKKKQTKQKTAELVQGGYTSLI